MVFSRASQASWPDLFRPSTSLQYWICKTWMPATSVGLTNKNECYDRHNGIQGRAVGKITGFLEYEREDRDYEPVGERVRHWGEFVLPLPEQDYVTQAARCMN